MTQLTPNIKQVTKKQHFVPQFYLKKFANSNGFVEVLDLKNRKIVKPRPFGGICYEKYFYALKTGKKDDFSQDIEDYFQALEDRLSPKYNRFIEKVLNYEQVLNEDIYYVSSFMSMLWIRSKYFRENMNKMNSKVLKEMNQRRASHPDFEKHMKEIIKKKDVEKKMTDDDIETYRELMLSGEYDLKFSNQHHLKFLAEIEPFSNLFYAKNWRAHFAPKGSKFITSDTPVAELIPKRTGFWGATFIERNHYLTITPEVVIELINPVSGKKFRRKMVSKNEVSKLNAIRANLSLDYCYGQRKDEFNEMIKIAQYYNPVSQLLKKQL